MLSKCTLPGKGRGWFILREQAVAESGFAGQIGAERKLCDRQTFLIFSYAGSS